MKIGIFELDIEIGKNKYETDSFKKLVEKFAPNKVSPFMVEFVDDIEKSDVIVFNPEKKFDLAFLDLDKIDIRLTRTTDEEEKALLLKAQKSLEDNILLNELEFTDKENEYLKPLAFFTHKPCAQVDSGSDMSVVIEKALIAAKTIIFYTAGKKEVHAWNVNDGETAVDAAGRIHSDLARGFIKAEIVNVSQLDNFFNMAEAKSKGLLELVDKTYVMKQGDIIDVKFNV